MDKRPIYYRFEDIPQTNNYYSQYSKSPGFSFSKTEISQIFIAITVLTIAFSFALAPYPPLGNLGAVFSNIPFAFLAILTAFFCHELAHKYVGQRFGYWSEFRMYGQGLLLALFFGIFTGFIIALPGAVQILGRPRKDEMGKIAMAGPITNVLLSGLFFTIMSLTSGLIANIAFFIAYINAFLALFNLLPFGMFDGRKIFDWRKELWVLLLIISLTFFILLVS